ncbi:MAG: sensor histidine kinase [Corynebacterium casei]
MALFIFIMSHSVIGVPALSLMFLVVIMVFAAKGYMVATVVGTIIIWYAGLGEWANGEFIPSDWVEASVWAMVVSLSVIAGYVSYRSGRQQKYLHEQWDTDVKTRRKTMGKMLHDSVASSLTSLIMRLEAMSLQPDLAPATRKELVDLSEQARLSMKEVRDLLRTLSTEDSPRANEPALSISDQLRKTTSNLKSHGFTVMLTGSIPKVTIKPGHLKVLREVFGELSTNIVKYAEPHSTVAFSFHDTGSNIHMSITNVIRPQHHNESLSSGMGIPALSTLMEGIGGNLTILTSSDEWKSELEISYDTE